MPPGRDAVADRVVAEHPQADALLKRVIEHAPVVLWAIDREGRFTLSAGRGLEALGLRPGEAVGRSAFEMYRDVPRIVESLHAALAGREQTLTVEVGGQWFENWSQPLRDHQGQIVGAMGVATDITARVLAERSERTSADLFLKAFHVSPAGILLTHIPSGQILDANAAFCRLTGYARQDLLSRTTVEMGLWSSHEERWKVLGVVAQGQPTRLTDYPLRLKNGTTIFVENSMEPVQIDGQPCALSIMHDAAVQRRYERALQRSRRQYRTLARFAPVGLFRMNRSGEWLYTNRQCRRLLGCEAAALRGRGWLEAIHPEDRAGLLDCGRSSSTAPCRQEVRTWSSAASARWLLVQWEPRRGRRAGIGTLTDITERKLAELELQTVNRQLEEHVRLRTELLLRTSKTLEEQIHERRRTYQELERSEARWRSLVEDAPDVILQLNRQGQIEFRNHPNQQGGLPLEAVLGRSITELVAPEFVPEVERSLAEVIEQGRTVTLEVQALKNDGAAGWFQGHLAPLWHNGQVIGATVVVRDVTDQHRAAEELQQKQSQLAHVARVSMVGEMTAGFAHELNQPLAAIAHYIAGCVIRLQKEECADPKVITTLRDAAEEARRASEVVRRLRQFLHQHAIQRELADLNDVVREAGKLMECTLNKQQVRCEYRLDEGLPQVFMDRIQVMQVLLNLMLNAVEAMADVPADRRLIVVQTSQQPAGRVACAVRDQGPGLPQGLPHDIFDAFVTTKPEGLGLGLSISRSILQAHEGEIRARNHPEGGAEFELTFSHQAPGD